MSEKREAERDGARLHKNSGRGWIEKGDASLGPLCVDYKEYASTFGVSRAVWAKCTADALRMRKTPALKLVLGQSEPKTRLWVIDDVFFHEMYEAWQEKYEEGVVSKRITKTYADGSTKITFDPPIQIADVDEDNN